MRQKFIATLSLFLLVAVGCGWLSRPEWTDAEVGEAQQTLIAALNAWKSGQVDELAKQSPPIRFQDDDFMAGWHLVDFQLKTPASQIEPFQDVKVQVHLKDVRGTPIRKEVAYQVGLNPNTVQRSDN
jgi:hypothetical protein